MQKIKETQVWSLGWEDPLEEGMTTHSSILSGRTHRQRSLESCSSWGCKESDMTEVTVLSVLNVLENVLGFAPSSWICGSCMWFCSHKQASHWPRLVVDQEGRVWVTLSGKSLHQPLVVCFLCLFWSNRKRRIPALEKNLLFCYCNSLKTNILEPLN